MRVARSPLTFLNKFAVADVKTALELSDQQFLTKYNRKKPTTDDEIIFSCRLGMRTLKAAVTASSLGYKK